MGTSLADCGCSGEEGGTRRKSQAEVRVVHPRAHGKALLPLKGQAGQTQGFIRAAWRGAECL